MANRPGVTLGKSWAVLLHDAGVDARAVLANASLPPEAFLRSTYWVSPEQFFILWQAVEAEFAESEVALKLGLSFTTEAFHPPLFAALCSENLMQAAERLSKFKRLIAPMDVHGEVEGETFAVSIRWDDPTLRIPDSLVAMELVLCLRMARMGTRRALRPVEVVCPGNLTHPGYAEFFGVSPQQGPMPLMRFTLEDARRPFLTADEALWRTFEPELQQRLAVLDATVPLGDRVRGVLLEGLPSGRSTIEYTSRRLGVSPRTLQRRLRQDGLSYREVLDSTRERLAHHYLTRTDLSYGEISFLLGFSEPSPFFRAFRNWTGETPESVRRQHNSVIH